MEIKFMKQERKPKFIKGVLYGDSGTGKTTFALNFAIKSAEKRNIKDVLLVDTENGWDWIRQTPEAEKINIIEAGDKLTKDNFLNYFKAIQKYVKNNEVSCLVIDSVSKIGELIAEKIIDDVNQKNKKYNKPMIEDLRYTDWGDIREQQNKIIDILRALPCDVLLCGRASSDKETAVVDKKSTIIDAKERTLTGWKKITYEFDFTILADVDIDINQKNIKSFNFLVIKSRIENDGEKVKNINHWFNRIDVDKKIPFKDFETKIKNAESEEVLNNYVREAGMILNAEKDKIIAFSKVEYGEGCLNSQFDTLIKAIKTRKNELIKE